MRSEPAKEEKKRNHRTHSWSTILGLHSEKPLNYPEEEIEGIGMVGIIPQTGILEYMKERTCLGTGSGMRSPIKSPKTEIGEVTGHAWQYPNLERVEPRQTEETS